MEAQRAERIQVRIDDDTATLPYFHGNQKDSISLKFYISRIDQGIETLAWTQLTAFTYFSNSVKSVAAAWLECFLTDNPDIPRSWDRFKLPFRRAFGDTTDPIIFAQELCNIRPDQHGNCLFTYYAAITRAVNLHQEDFLTPPAQPPLPDDHGYNNAQQLLVQNVYANAHTAAVRNVHTKLRKEFFLNGLPKKQLDLVANKPHLTTVNEMIAFIHQQETIDRKKVVNGTTTTNGTSASAVHTVVTSGDGDSVEKEDNVAAASSFQNRGQQPNRGYFNPGSNYRGNPANFRGNNQTSRGGQNNRGGNAFTGNRGGNAYAGNRGGNSYTGNTNTNNRSSTSQNGKNCVYCKGVGHIQDDCYSRINKNDPCINAQGKTYFPKINEISSSSVFFFEN